MSGAGDAAGGDFQNRVAAWIAVQILVERKAAPPSWLAPNGPVEYLRCQEKSPVDDVVVGTSSGGRTFVQAKRSVALSPKEASHLGMALDQMVRQFLVCAGSPPSAHPLSRPLDPRLDRLALACGPGSSRSISENLPCVLDRIRKLPPELPIGDAARNQDDREVIDTLLGHVDRVWRREKERPPSDGELRTLFSFLHVGVAHVEDDGTEEIQARMMLRGEVLQDPSQADAAWGALVATCGGEARKQSGATRESLRTLLLDKGLQPKAHGEVSPARTGTDGIHADLDEVKACLDKGLPREATFLLDKLRRRSWADMTGGQRARWCEMEGDARLRLAEPQAASAAMLDARAHAPHDERANEIGIRGYLVAGELDAARALAAEVRQVFPGSPAVLALSIELAPSAAEAEAHIKLVPAPKSESLDVLLAIAARPDSGEHGDEAAKRATDLYPNDSCAWFLLGNRLLVSEQDKLNPRIPVRTGTPSRKRLGEARGAFSRVLERTEKTGNLALRVRALLHRIAASGLMGDADAVRSDTDTAIRLAPDDPEVLVAAARCALARASMDDAIGFLRRATAARNANPASFLLGVILFDRDAPGDRDEATRIFLDVAQRKDHDREAACMLAIEGLLARKEPAEASAFVGRVGAELDPALVATLRARIEHAGGDSAASGAWSEKALAAISGSTTRTTVMKLASVLMGQSQYEMALPLLERIAAPGGDEQAGRLYIKCAAQLGRHAAILDYCRRSREEGVSDKALLDWEIRVLSDYDMPAAVGLLEEVLGRNQGLHRSRVRLVTLLLRLGRRDAARAHLKSLPAVAEVDAREGAEIVDALLALGEARWAMEYAYDLLRLHFLEADAHRAFRNAVLLEERQGEVVSDPDAVAPGVAVALAEDTEIAWYVLEDSPVKATGLADERAADSPFARMLLGKRVGDVVQLSGAPGTERPMRVNQILSKYAFRFSDVLRNWQVRFPEHQEMWMVRVGDPRSGEIDLTRVKAVADSQRRGRDEAIDLFRKNRLPLAFFADCLGQDLVHTVCLIAETKGVFLDCCTGSPQELEESLSSIEAAQEVVMDLSALATLLLLDMLPSVASLRKKLVISQSTQTALRSMVESAKTDLRSRGGVDSNEKGLVFHPRTPEQSREALAFWERTMAFVDREFEVRGALDLARLNQDVRDKLVEALGRPALESIAIATHPDRVLWTDDLVSALFVRDRFAPRRCWSQAAFTWMLEHGRMDAETYSRTGARLLSWGYRFTGADQGIMSAAGRLAEWKPDRPPLREAIEYLALAQLMPRYAIALGVFLVREGYRQAALVDGRRAVLDAVLDQLSARKDFKEPSLDLFARLLLGAFGVDVLGADDALAAVRLWRARQGGDIIQPP